MFDHAGQSWGGPSSHQRFGDPNEPWSRAPSEESAAKIERMATLLSKKLGPEYLSSRQGPGGGKLTYIEGWRVMSLANEVFGFNGWATAVKDLSIDFIDYSEETQRWNAHVTAIVRITLPDGCYHEDVGCGKIDNCKSKADALDKIKKEAVTDATKRALRSFGNLLGNCLYDKRFLDDIAKVKAPGKPQFDFDDIHRPGRTYDSDGKPIPPGQTVPKPPVPGPSTIKSSVPVVNPPMNKPAAAYQHQQQQQQQKPMQQAGVNRPPVPQAQHQQQQPQQQQQQQQQYVPSRAAQPVQQPARPPQHQQQLNRPQPILPIRAAINNSINANQHAPQMRPIIPNAPPQVRQQQHQQQAPAAVNQHEQYDEPNSEDYFDPEFDMAAESVLQQPAAPMYDDSGFAEGPSVIVVKQEQAKIQQANPLQPQGNTSNRGAQQGNAHQAGPTVLPPMSKVQNGTHQHVNNGGHSSNAGQHFLQGASVASVQVGQRGPTTSSSPEMAMRSAGQGFNQIPAVRHLPQGVTTSTPTGPAKLQFRPSQGEPLVGFAPPPAGLPIPESVTFTSARGIKRALPAEPEDGDAFIEQDSDQMHMQPPQRAMSPLERAREAEQLQFKQQLIAQNRQAAIEKRQRIANRQSGEKPVSI